MASKPVNLSLHKSQIERKRRRDVRAHMVRDVKAIASSYDVVAFAIVTLNANGNCCASWDTGGAVPMWAFPEAVSSILAHDIKTSGSDDDFTKPLIDRAWRGSK